MSTPLPPDQQLASPGSRFLAAVIDGVLGGVFWLVPFGFVAGIIYSFVKDALPFLNGQSIGKRAMSIRVVRVQDGSPITNDYVTAIVRQISLCIPVFNIIDMLMVFSAERRRFGDRWAKTVVVRAAA